MAINSYLVHDQNTWVDLNKLSGSGGGGGCLYVDLGGITLPANSTSYSKLLAGGFPAPTLSTSCDVYPLSVQYYTACTCSYSTQREQQLPC